MDDDVLDSARVEMLDGLVKDGLSLFHRAAASFMGRVGDQLVAIRDAVTRDHATSLLNSAHQLKGSALNVGLPRVAQAAERLESLGSDGHTTGAGPMLTDLTREVEAALAALKQATSRDR
jgi:HPt (histidine-containing phosphotransfer) domain-containing protein